MTALPRDETAFFGRTREIEDLESRLASGARLVSIIGLGGVGKTRLALAVASRWKGDVTYVSLDEARDLKVTQGLVVLENTEQLGAAARDLVDGLLRGASKIVILATAREPIGSRGEEKVMLAPLDEADAVALLRDRARMDGGGDVELSDDHARAIVERVDRLPLGIELAASRLGVLSPAELLERLTTLHRTMRATLDWSWELLDSSERDVLTQASVFAAPFGIDAAEEILEAGEKEVLDVLESLVRRSLVTRVVGASKVRLAMYETVRAWAREKLGTAKTVHRRHAMFHLAAAERAALQTYGDRAVAALDELQAMLPELRVAFEAMKESEPGIAARIVLAATDLLLFRSLSELRAEWVTAALTAAERSQDDRVVARVLVAKARVTLEEGRMQDAETELRRALALSEDDVTKAEATRSLGWALTALGRTEEAEAALNAAQKMHRQHGNVRGIADSHVALGILRALLGSPQEGLAQLREALAIHVEHGDVIRQEKVLGFAALVGQDAREVARGLPRDVLARTASEASGGSWQQAIDLHRQGAAAYDRGDADGAIALFDRAVALLDRSGVKRGLATLHAQAAAAYAMTGDAAEAAARLDRARKATVDGDASTQLAVNVLAAAVAMMAAAAPSVAKKEESAALLVHATRPEIGTPELAIATRILERAIAAPGKKKAAGELVVGPEARFIIPPNGVQVDLVRYGPIRRLLDRLVTARLETPGVALTAEQLIEAGWPGERMRHSAGLLRVYSAVRRLRRLGLDRVLVTRDDGYLLDANSNVRREN